MVGAAAARRTACSAATRSSACSTSRASSPERAIHEWTAQVFRADDGTVLVGPVPAHDPHRAREGPGDAASTTRRRDRRRTPTKQIDDDRRAVRARASDGAAPSRAGGRTSTEGDEVGPMVKGPLTRHRHGLLARRHGHGPLRREGAAARRTGTASASRASSTATSSTSPT